LELFLKSGIMTKEGWEPSELGSPQGGVISPLIANVYLDEFDQFMMKRSHRIVRYADDLLILTRSKSAAENVMAKAKKYLENELGLKVNTEKTHIVHSISGVKFLGVVIHSSYTRIQRKKIKEFKGKIKKITRRNSPVNLERIIKELNPVLRGFTNYFRIANCNSELRDLSGWIRRRLRAKQMKLLKKPKKLHRRLRQLGYKGEFKSIKMNSWKNSSSPLINYALPNDYFNDIGLFDLKAVKTGLSVPT